jgi:AmmeMemoRadiSam system protein B
MLIRPTAVAGAFYPNSASEIQNLFDLWHSEAGENESSKQTSSVAKFPRALIVPHAGYVYSGQMAFESYQLWQASDGIPLEEIKTVVVMGPAHRYAFEGIATVSAEALETPLGNLAVDTQLRDALLAEFGSVIVSDEANAPEHSIEVHLPFIKAMLPNAKVLPLLNGDVSVDEVTKVLSKLWSRSDVYFVISSDLSHFHSYAEAQQIDQQTAQLINTRNWPSLSGARACGYKGIQGLLNLENSSSFDIQELQLNNSGDSAGDKQRVVGYGSWAIYEEVK